MVCIICLVGMVAHAITSRSLYTCYSAGVCKHLVAWFHTNISLVPYTPVIALGLQAPSVAWFHTNISLVPYTPVIALGLQAPSVAWFHTNISLVPYTPVIALGLQAPSVAWFHTPAIPACMVASIMKRKLRVYTLKLDAPSLYLLMY